jgi:hypothetical protein
MRWRDLSGSPSSQSRNAPFALVYATADAPLDSFSFAPGTLVVGCTSSGGVFTPRGFSRGGYALTVEDHDGVDVRIAGGATTASSAREAAREAARQVCSQLGRAPDAFLLHGTPGYEERLLEGIAEAFEGSGSPAPPVYGGSAADDDLSGKWRIRVNDETLGEGFVLAGFASKKTVHGAFVAGYLPGAQRGVVTAAEGRRVYTIDGRPAAEVYNLWRDGALRDVLGQEAIILARTTMNPIGREIDRVGRVPRYLLSHPHAVHSDGSMSFFTEFAVGETLVLMMGSLGSLLERTDQAVHRALHGDRSANLRGGILIYCGGCVMALGQKTDEVATLFAKAVKNAPFLGAATFGEIGCFPGPSPVNRHGNLMCDVLLFD